MSIDFASPSFRAAGQDLTVSISPLGLVELADEEFEIHGPRLNRYSINWATYLGHHYSYRTETGEEQPVYNYYRAFTDFLTRFTFGHGVQFSSPDKTSAIVPHLLKRVWETDNDKMKVLFEMGTSGAVSGDCFVKVAYEEPFQDSIGRVHPGRVRILPLNAAYCFPEYHPHDRSRLVRMKIKYRFWGTSPQGTRSVYTYVEVLTEDTITEYINDEMIDQRPNPIGTIPVVHIPNLPIPSSPWGLSDCQDIIQLNLQYNAINKDVSDIINYHSAPVTVIVGAKASQLEKGAKKVWGGLPKEAQVFNLEGGGAGLNGALEYLEKIKRSMHEIVGIPETALGQVQPISNTSGVALSIQFQPLMNRWAQKTAQYGDGLQKVNELILLTLAVKEPDTFTWVPNDDVPLEQGQVDRLDPNDPTTYLTTVHFPPPLPLDKLVVLNEIQMKMQMSLESREGALRTLGEEYPKQKLAEIADEMMHDAVSDGALQLLRTQIQKEIMDLTAMMPGIDGGPATPLDPMMAQMASGEYLGDGNVQPPPPPVDQPKIDLFLGEEYLRNKLVTDAYGTKRVSSPEKPTSTKDA